MARRAEVMIVTIFVSFLVYSAPMPDSILLTVDEPPYTRQSRIGARADSSAKGMKRWEPTI